ncbi:MAG: undecaprenyl-phosphate glucose phosphotransferase [Flavobacteriales bacterium]|nr:undecaprenyl-phosphate glucose phosphotransferase [Flavobacteriales bacterium]
MKLKLSRYEKLLYLFLDLVMLNLSFLVGFAYRKGDAAFLGDANYQVLFIFINISWLLVAALTNEQLENRRAKTRRVIWDFIKMHFFSLLLVLSFVTVVKGGEQYARGVILYHYLVFFVLGSLARAFFNLFLKLYRKKGFNYRRVVVVGVNPFSIEFVHEIIEHSEYGYKFMGFFDNKNDTVYDVGKIRSLEELNSFLVEFDVDEVYLSLPSYSDYSTKSLIKFCTLNYIKVNFLNEFIHFMNKKSVQVNIDYNGPTPIVSVVKEPLEETVNKVLKRAFDIVFSLLVLILIFPWLYLISAIFIKLGSPGPVFFKQKRSGIDNSVFDCYKFRTMVQNSDSDSKQATSGDARITRFGQFLRNTNLDEFPQFINVLKGEMSVVGPRPHMLEHTRLYSKIITPFMIRHWVKPGITGLAQAKGLRGETKEISQMYGRVKMDVFYIQNWSFLLDLKIVFMTIWNMLTFQKTGA